MDAAGEEAGMIDEVAGVTGDETAGDDTTDDEAGPFGTTGADEGTTEFCEVICVDPAGVVIDAGVLWPIIVVGCMVVPVVIVLLL